MKTFPWDKFQVNINPKKVKSEIYQHDFSLTLMYRLIFSGNQDVGLRGEEMETENR